MQKTPFNFLFSSVTTENVSKTILRNSPVEIHFSLLVMSSNFDKFTLLHRSPKHIHLCISHLLTHVSEGQTWCTYKKH